MTAVDAIDKLDNHDDLTEKEIYDLELIVASSAVASIYYAENILKSPFLLGEPIIALKPALLNYMLRHSEIDIKDSLLESLKPLLKPQNYVKTKKIN